MYGCDWRWKARFVPTLVGYFDESGHSSNTDFISIGAFVAEEVAWARISEAWTGALERSGAPYLHMADFAHSQGVYAGWDEPRRRRLLAECVSAINAVR